MDASTVLNVSTFTVAQASERWNASKDDVRKWCNNGFVCGARKAEKFPFGWMIPALAKRPIDLNLARELLWQCIELQNKRVSEFDLTNWGVIAEDIGEYIDSLGAAGYLRGAPDAYIVTERGLTLLGRNGKPSSAKDVPEVLIWTASVGGAFAGTAIKQAVIP